LAQREALHSAVAGDVPAQLFELRRAVATKRIVDAAQHISFGDAERLPIVVLLENLERYLEAASRSRHLSDVGDQAGALDAYRVATDLMHSKILPAAVALDDAVTVYLEGMFEARQRAGGGAEILATLVGGALVFVLVLAQVFITRRMRRMTTPALLAATLLAGTFNVYLVARFGTAREDLRIAKQDAFDSIHMLWRMRAIASDANGDESRFLLDRDRASTFESAFLGGVAQLTANPSSKDLSQLSAGLLADELRNVTFAGEREAGNALLTTFADYYLLDQKMRRLERSGRHEDAVQLCVGSRDDALTAAFDRFDEAVQRTLAINQRAFDQVLTEGDAGLRRAEKLDPVFAFAIAILAWLGIRPRIREYAA
jgi:hypothetical protein